MNRFEEKRVKQAQNVSPSVSVTGTAPATGRATNRFEQRRLGRTVQPQAVNKKNDVPAVMKTRNFQSFAEQKYTTSKGETQQDRLKTAISAHIDYAYDPASYIRDRFTNLCDIVKNQQRKSEKPTGAEAIRSKSYGAVDDAQVYSLAIKNEKEALTRLLDTHREEIGEEAYSVYTEALSGIEQLGESAVYTAEQAVSAEEVEKRIEKLKGFGTEWVDKEGKPYSGEAPMIESYNAGELTEQYKHQAEIERLDYLATYKKYEKYIGTRTMPEVMENAGALLDSGEIDQPTYEWIKSFAYGMENITFEQYDAETSRLEGVKRSLEARRAELEGKLDSLEKTGTGHGETWQYIPAEDQKRAQELREQISALNIRIGNAEESMNDLAYVKRYSGYKSRIDGLDAGELHSVKRLWELQGADLISFSGKKNLEATFERNKLQGRGYSEEEINDLVASYGKLQNAENAASQSEKWIAEASEGGTGASLNTLGTSLVSGVSAIPEAVRGTVMGAIHGEEHGIDLNAAGFTPLRYTNTVRNTVADNIKQKYGSTPSFLYQTGMSVLDSAVSMTAGNVLGGASAIAGVSTKAQQTIAKGATNFIMSSASGANAVYDSIKKGYSNSRSLFMGMSSALIETLTEKYSLDAIFDAVDTGDIYKIIRNSALAEGSEELASFAATTTVDLLVNADQSELKKTYRGYLNSGMSEKDAALQTLYGVAGEALATAFAGALSGAAMGSVSAGFDRLRNGRNASEPAAQTARHADEVQTPVGSVEQGAAQTTVSKTGEMSDDMEDTVPKRQYAIKYPKYTETELTTHAQKLVSMSSVKALSGNEFSDDGTKTLRQRITEYFEGLGNSVYSDQFGDVALTLSSVRSEIRHGTTKNKIISYAAIPEVITNGVVIDQYKGGNGSYERIVVAAPITITGNPYYMGVMLQRDNKSQRLYLHDVIAAEEADLIENEHLVTNRGAQESDNLFLTSILKKAISVKRMNNTDGVMNASESARSESTTDGDGIVFDVSDQARTYAASNGIDESGRLVLPTVRDARVNKLVSGMMQTADPQTRERASRATNDTTRSGILAGARGEDIDTACAIGRAVGRKIVFYRNETVVNGMRENGYYDGGDTLYINTASGDPIVSTVAHELTHSIEGTAAYSQLRSYIDARLHDSGSSLENMAQVIRDTYSRAGKNLTDKEADREAVASYVQNQLLTDESAIFDIARERPTLAQRIYRFINGLLERLRNKKASQRMQIVRMRDAYAKALRQTQNASTSASGNNTQHSVSSVDNDNADGYNEDINQEDGKDGQETYSTSTSETWWRGDDRTERGRAQTASGMGEIATGRTEGGVPAGRSAGSLRLRGYRGTTDSEGRVISEGIASKTQNSAIVDSNGNLLAVYHFTPNMHFKIFGVGDIGFHFGTIEQAEARAKDKKYEYELAGNLHEFNGRYFRVYLNITNPLIINSDIGSWKPHGLALRLRSEGVITESELQEVRSLARKPYYDYKSDYDYDAPAATRLREILRDKGYDGLKYPNGVEGDGYSYAAFYPEQVITTDIYDAKTEWDTRDKPKRRYSLSPADATTDATATAPEDGGVSADTEKSIEDFVAELKSMQSGGAYEISEPTDDTADDSRYGERFAEYDEQKGREQQPNKSFDRYFEDIKSDAQYPGMNPRTIIAGQVNAEMPVPEKSVIRSLRDAWHSFYRYVVDSGESVARFGKQAGDKFLYAYYNMARSSTNAAVNMIAEERTNIRGETTGKGLNAIFAPIRRKGNKYYIDFQAYMLHMHNVDRMSRSDSKKTREANRLRQTFLDEHRWLGKYTEGEMKEISRGRLKPSPYVIPENEDPVLVAAEYIERLNEYEKAKNRKNKPVFDYSVSADDSREEAGRLAREHPEFHDLAQKVYDYIDNLMQYRVDSGLITDRDYEMWKSTYPHYVPVYRMVEKYGAWGGKGSVMVGKTVGRAVGGSEKIVPLHEALIRQTLSVVREGSKNRFGNRLLDDLDFDNSGFDARINPNEFVKDIKEFEGVLPVDLFDDLYDDRLERKNTFIVRRKGKQWEMTVSPGMYEAVESLGNTTDPGGIFEYTRKIVRVFKAMVTGWNPTFLLKNPIRDISDAAFNSKRVRSFLRSYPEAIKEVATNGPVWRQYIALGGVTSSVMDYKTRNIQPTLKQRFKGTFNGSVKKRLGNAALLGRDAVESANLIVEQLPRFAEFYATVKRGDGSMDNIMEALNNAAEITTNFGRSGSVGRFLNANLIPFLNPGIQGFDKFLRRIGENKEAKEWFKLVLKAAIFATPAVLNMLLYGDDEEYEMMHDREKDTNFLFKLSEGKWLKLPYGRVVSIFTMGANRIEKLLSGEEIDWGDTATTALSQIAPTNPLEENLFTAWFDTKLFDPSHPGTTWYGGDIESQRLQGYAPAERYDEKTDVISKWLGGVTGLSPKKINHLIDSYTGVVGDIILPLLTPTADRNLFDKAFISRPISNNSLSGDFYTKLDELQWEMNTVSSSGANAVTFRWWNKCASTISEVNKAIREIEANDSLSDKEKRELANIQYAIRNSAIQNAFDHFDSYKDAAHKYYDSSTISDEDDRIAYAYREANREIFGAEYALSVYDKNVYTKAQELQESCGISYEEFYEFYFEKLSIDPDSENKADQVRDIIEDSDLSDKEKSRLYEAYITNSFYDNIVKAGVSPEVAYRLSAAIDALEPVEGQKSVSAAQKYRAVLDAKLPVKEVPIAFENVMSDSDYMKYTVARDEGITDDMFVVFKEKLAVADTDESGSLSQAEVKAAINAMNSSAALLPSVDPKTFNLTSKQKAVLWQLGTGGKPASNPYNKVVATRVSKALDKLKEEAEEQKEAEKKKR